MAASAIVLPSVPITPPSYHRIVSPSLRIPSDTTIPIPVGLLACQRDPLLRELATTVVSCNVHQPPADTSPKDNRKKKSASATNQVLLEVVLHDTVLFPEGGGQPSDIGILHTSDGEEWDVVEVKRRGGHAVHFVRAGDAAVDIHRLAVGTQVTAALGDAGFHRRLDHMCMHTSQHLLSALLETHLDLPTLSWALTNYPSPSYVELPRALTSDEVARIQTLAHSLAYEGRNVHVEVEPLETNNRPGVAILGSGRTVGKALPQDYTGGVKRTVVIDGVDRNPCCGTHLPSLHNLQLFLLPQSESLARAGGTSTARLFFLCGPRLHAYLSSTHDLLTATAGIMSCGQPLVPSRVTQVVEERRRLDKRAEELEAELSKRLANDLRREMDERDASKDATFFKHYHRLDDPASALGFLQAIASSFANLPSLANRYLVVLTSSTSSQTGGSVTTVLLASPDEALVKSAGDALKLKLGVKGGGRGTRWSGKWIGVWKDSKEGKAVEEVLESLASP